MKYRYQTIPRHHCSDTGTHKSKYFIKGCPNCFNEKPLAFYITKSRHSPIVCTTCVEWLEERCADFALGCAAGEVSDTDYIIRAIEYYFRGKKGSNLGRTMITKEQKTKGGP